MTRFFRFICLAVLLLSAIPVVAQDAATASEAPQELEPVKPPAPPPHNARITGTVLCADTRHPARGAMVIVIPLAPADAKQQVDKLPASFARAGSDGTYVAEHLAPGEYSVLAMLPGYLSPMDDFTNANTRDISPQQQRELLLKYGSVVVAAKETGRFDLSLQRGAAVSGRVLYSDGSPASQINIDVQDINAKPPAPNSPENNTSETVIMRTLIMHESSGTDDQGHFRISGLPPGTYRVAAVQPPTDASNGSGAYVFGVMGLGTSSKDLHIYSGDTLHKKSAKTYEVRSGDEVSGIDITIPVDAFHRIQGRASAVDGRPINTARLTLTDTADDSLVFRAHIRNDGTFVFGAVPAGTYTLAATQAKIGKAPQGFLADMELPPGVFEATNTFADSNTAVIVKDSDVPDVNLTLTEVSLPSTSPKSDAQNGDKGPLP